MKERLLQLLDLEHLTPSKFADLIGVQRSSVSHILSDRNKPSFDFLQKTLKTFPGLKAEWLMMGIGPMYEQMGREGADLFNQNPSETIEDLADDQMDIPDDPLRTEVTAPETVEKAGIREETNMLTSDESRKVVQVMLFFDDNTFVTYRPSE